MKAPSSSSFDAATTTVELAAAAAAVLMTVALDQKLENQDDKIIFNNIVEKCHKCLKMNLIIQPSCFFIEYWRSYEVKNKINLKFDNAGFLFFIFTLLSSS